MSIMMEHIHLAKSGKTDHDMVGPISTPNVGPTLPMQLRQMVMELVLSIPIAIMINAISSSNSK